MLPLDIKDREYKKFGEDADGNVIVRTGLVVEDIEIGAVELKNASDDTRAKVKTDGTDNALVVTQNTVPTTTVKTASDTPVKALLTESDGTALRQVTITGSEKGLSTAISQDIRNVHLTTTPLAYNATWTGEATLTDAATTIQTFFKADQRAMIYIDQGVNGTDWELTDEWLVYENEADGRLLYSVAPYFRARVKNVSVSSEAMTSMVFASALTPNMAIMPRTLDAHGSLKTCIQNIHSEFDKDVDISPMGAMKTSTNVRVVGASFIGTTMDTNFWASTLTGTGTATQAEGTLTLATGTTANSTAKVNSVKTARYVCGTSNYYRGEIRLPAVTTASASFVNTRRWGAFDANDGYFFEAVQTNPDTNPILRVVCRKSTVDTAVASGSFNGEANDQYILNNNIHTYEIHWTNKNAYFKVDDDVIHTFTGSTTTLVATSSLKIGEECNNSGSNNANNSLAVRSSTIHRFGVLETAPTFAQIAGASTNILKYGPGHLHKIILNNPASGNITVYDNTAGSGTVIAIINPASSGTPVTLHYHLPFSTGLTVVTSAAASNTTVVYE
jgi:hypothetical protein